MTPLVLLLAWPAHGATLEVGAGQTYGTVADAVAAAAPGDEVLVHPGTYVEELDLTGLQLTVRGATIAEAVVLQANGGPLLRTGNGSNVVVEDLTLDGVGAERIAFVEGTGLLTLRGVVARNGLSDTGGCAHVHNNAEMIAEDSTFEACVGTSDGGAIYLHNDAKLVVRRTVFQGNTGRKGGALSCQNNAICSVEDSVLAGSVATDQGGAIEHSANRLLVVARTLFADNQTPASGGALYIAGPTTLTDNVFCENHADGTGGALHVEEPVDVVNNHFLGNTSGGTGSAIFANDSTLFANNLVWGNQGAAAAVAGGAFLDLRHGWYFDNVVIDEDSPNDTNNTYGVDPELAGYTAGNCLESDFRLAPTSPLIDAGDPDPTYDDPDGTTADIGAWDATWADVLGDDTDGDGSPDDVDCAPYDPGIHPGEPEVPGDGIDQDCSGSDDCFVDLDGDGYGDGLAPATTADCSGAGEAVLDGDCDDASAAVNPGADEVCDPLDVDEDCDGLADDADDDTLGLQVLYEDADNDGYGAPGAAMGAACDPAPGTSLTDDDCNDMDATISPGAVEQCDPLDVDEDCNGLADDDDPAPTGTTEHPVDADGDGYAAEALGLACDPPDDLLPGVDCDDTRADVSPDGTEVCDPDNADEDCDGLADDEDPDVQGTVAQYPDGDLDGYGAGTAGAERVCDPGPGWSLTSDDCDDGRSDVNPGAEEVCDPDDVDEDCDGLADDADDDAVGTVEVPIDEDGDGFAGDEAVATCEPPAQELPGGDCADGDPSRYPGAEDIPGDGIDQNCSGTDLVQTWGSGGGCGCQGAPSSGLGSLLVLLGTVARRH